MHCISRATLLLPPLLLLVAAAQAGKPLRYCTGELVVVEVGGAAKAIGCVGPSGELLAFGKRAPCAEFVVERNGDGKLHIGNVLETTPAPLAVGLSRDNRLDTLLRAAEFDAQNLEWSDAVMPLPDEWSGAARELRRGFGGRLVRARDRDPRFSAVRGLEAAPALDFLFSNSLGNLAIVCPLKPGEAV